MSPAAAAQAQERLQAQAPPPELPADEVEHLVRERWERRVEVRQPLALVTQAPRAGGTLLMRLLDGHPRCHTMAQEMGIHWEKLARAHDSPDLAWSHVGGERVAYYFKSGVTQMRRKGKRQKSSRSADTLPFLTPPTIARAIFDTGLSRSEAAPARAVLDAYFTAYFNAWLDNGNLLQEPKRWVTGFQPRVLASEALGHFWDAYPDGRLISIVRDPAGWFASARIWSTEWRQAEGAMQAWEESTRAAMAVAEERDEQVLLLTFADLVAKTEKTMRRVVRFLGLPFSPTVLVPTFNGLPIRANSSFAGSSTQVSREPLNRARASLDRADRDYIGRHSQALYEEFVSFQRERHAKTKYTDEKKRLEGVDDDQLTA